MNFTDEDCANIFNDLFLDVQKNGRVTRDEAVEKLSSRFSTIGVEELGTAIYDTIRDGKIPQLKLVKGRYGGIRLNEKYFAGTPEATGTSTKKVTGLKIVPSPTVQTLAIMDTEYNVDLPAGKIATLIVDILGLQKFSAGEIVFNNARYTGTTEKIDMLGKIMKNFFSAEVTENIAEAV